MCVLVLWEGGSVVRPLAKGARLVVGRGADCDVVVLHPSVSRKHVEIEAGPPLLVRDLGSANGARVGGKVVAKGQAVELRIGEAVEVGAALLIVQGPVAQEAGSAQPPTMAQVDRLVNVVAPSGLSVLLLGETGVGKEVIAQRIHALSPRASGPFVRVNCASLTESLLESELFGHEKGAFTGAVQSTRGLVEAADGGTLFLDEIGEMPLITQAKVLHLVENREVRRVGSAQARAVDVRFTSATNRDLEAAVEAGTFRQDLYYRLNGISVRIPPLRERRGEIHELARTFVAAAARSGPPPPIARATVDCLEAHKWPGNVRELRNVMERAIVLSGGGELRPEHLLLVQSTAAPADLRSDLQAIERQRIERALAEARGNQTRAAEILGISRRTLINRMETYDLPRPRRPR